MWSEAGSKKVRLTFKNSLSHDVIQIEKTLDEWLCEDDGGSIGSEQGFHEVGRRIYDDPDSGYNYDLEDIEMLDA